MLPSNLTEWALLVVGAIAGHYVVGHMRMTGKVSPGGPDLPGSGN